MFYRTLLAASFAAVFSTGACAAVSAEEAKQLWPRGWQEPKPYIRIVPQPELERSLA